MAELIERGVGLADNSCSFRNRIALQFLNDYPTVDSDKFLLDEDLVHDDNIQGMSFVSQTLAESS